MAPPPASAGVRGALGGVHAPLAAAWEGSGNLGGGVVLAELSPGVQTPSSWAPGGLVQPFPEARVGLPRRRGPDAGEPRTRLLRGARWLRREVPIARLQTWGTLGGPHTSGAPGGPLPETIRARGRPAGPRRAAEVPLRQAPPHAPPAHLGGATPHAAPPRPPASPAPAPAARGPGDAAQPAALLSSSPQPLLAERRARTEGGLERQARAEVSERERGRTQPGEGERGPGTAAHACTGPRGARASAASQAGRPAPRASPDPCAPASPAPPLSAPGPLTASPRNPGVRTAPLLSTPRPALPALPGASQPRWPRRPFRRRLPLPNFRPRNGSAGAGERARGHGAIVERRGRR